MSSVLLAKLGYHFFTTRQGWQGRQRYLEELSVVPPTDANDWPDWLPQHPRKLKKFLLVLDPIFILLQSMGLEVTNVTIAEVAEVQETPEGGTSNHEVTATRQVVIDRREMTVSALQVEGTDGIPLSAQDSYLVHDYMEEEDYLRGIHSANVDTYGVSFPTIVVTFRTTGLLGQTASQFLLDRLRNVDVRDDPESDDQGRVYVFPRHIYFEDGQKFPAVLKAIGYEIGNDKVVPGDKTIRHQIISKIVHALCPDSDTTLGISNVSLDPAKLQYSGLMWDPNNWLFPNLWLEDVDAMATRVMAYRRIGDLVWPWVTRSSDALRSFLEYETAGFGAGAERPRNSIITLKAQLDRIWQGRDHDGTEVGRAIPLPDGSTTVDLIGNWVRSTMAYEAIYDKQLASQTPRSLKDGQAQRMTYTEFLTATYRHGGIDFKGSSSAGGWGLRLGTTDVPEEWLAIAHEAGMTVNELSHPDLQQLQALFVPIWYAFLPCPRVAREALERIRGYLDTTGRTKIDDRLAIFGGAQQDAAVAILDQAITAIMMMEVALGAARPPSPLDQNTLLDTFQYIGAAFTALDPILIYEERALTPQNMLSHFADGFVKGVSNTDAGRLEVPEPRTRKYVFMDDGGPLVGGDSLDEVREAALALFERHLGYVYLQGLAAIPLLGGIVRGAAEYLDQTIYELLGFLENPAGAIESVIEGLRQMFNEYLTEIAEALGQVAGESARQAMATLLKTTTWYEYAYELGRMIAPVVVAIVIEIAFEAYIVIPVLQAGAQALRTAIRGVSNGFADIGASAASGAAAVAPSGKIHLPNAYDGHLDAVDLPDKHIEDLPSSSRDASSPEPDSDPNLDDLPAGDGVTLADGNDAPTGALLRSDVDAMTDRIDAELGMGNFFARHFPEGDSHRENLVKAFNTDPKAFAVFVRELQSVCPMEGQLTARLRVVMSNKEGARIIRLIGRADPPEGLDIGMELATIGSLLPTQRLQDELFDIAVRLHRKHEDFVGLVDDLPTAQRRRLLNRWFDDDMLSDKFGRGVSLEDIGFKAAAGRRSDELSDRFHFTSQQIDAPEPPSAGASDRERKLYEAWQATVDARPPDGRTVANIAEGWLKRVYSRELPRTDAEQAAQRAATELARRLDLEASSTLPFKLPEPGSDEYRQIEDWLEETLVNSSLSVDDLEPLTPLMAKALRAEQQDAISFLRSLLRNGPGSWDGGHVIGRSLGAAFPELYNLIPANARINRSFQRSIEIKLENLLKDPDLEDNLYLKVEVEGPWEDGVPTGVRYRAYEIDDATGTIKERLSAYVSVDTYVYVPHRRLIDMHKMNTDWY